MRKMKTLGERFWEKVKISDGCWNWTGSTGNYGYGQIRINGKIVRAHRLSFEMENGPIPKGICVLHKCDNPPCVNPAHLWLGTKKENTDDMCRKGRGGDTKGEKSGNAKISELIAQTIQRALRFGFSAKHISKNYKVSWHIVREIQANRTWRHVSC